MKRSFKLSSYTMALFLHGYILHEKSNLSTKGKISGDAMEILGFL